MASLEYQLSGPSLREIEEALDKLWVSLKTDPDLRRRAKEAKINLARVPSGQRVRVIKLRRKGAGLDPATTAVVVAITLGGKILRDVWKHLLLPRLRKQYGDDALKEAEKQKKGKAPNKRK